MSNSSLKRKLDSSNEVNTVSNRSQVLNDKLSRRPDRHQLVEQGILHDSHCAPSLQHAEQALKRARLADELNNRLLNRPGPLDLIKHNILHIDTPESQNLEQAIQGGQIPFKKTPYRRSLIFHEYTGSPSSCKPKVTKVDSLTSSSSAHQIRLAQQQLLLELTADNNDVQPTVLPQKSLEQMTLVELRELCKQYQIPSSHTNKTKLIERIKQTQDKMHNQNVSTSDTNAVELSNAEIIASLKISDLNEEEVQTTLSSSELDEILQSISFNQTTNFDMQNLLIDPQIITNDDLFVEMLLNNDYSSTSTNETDFLPVPSPNLPRITSVDEFDAFLRDFTFAISPHQQEILTSIS
ncbi:unnamed protein product [Adineta ricciae]|uniref:SAP domain-containing protein n=1 Tax=Adineta ricciae TaxID=249248 RepID=A0A815ZAT0_ADIRI|nr:unnamed protein product [Adineta ricciae]